MKIILIGNYLPDRQESMIRFGKMLHTGFYEAGLVTEMWNPTIFFGTGQKNTGFGYAKWLGYLDKWVIFPVVLRWRLRNGQLKKGSAVRFHVCDHSNAPYLKYLPAEQTCITCHDVLAIRGALGHADSYTQATALGKRLQSWIFYYLSRAQNIAAVSQFTLNQLQGLVPEFKIGVKNWQVIHNAFNADFGLLNESKRQALLKEAGLANIPFVLHVGSGHKRKNRKLIIDMVAALGNRWTGVICFAGETVEKDLSDLAASYGIPERIKSIVAPDHDTLVALYGGCDAFLFPSFSEGFGWPLIEAQACGAPVLASNIEPMPEISGGAALHNDPDDVQGFANAFLTLSNKNFREEMIRQGYKNAQRFNKKEMIKQYMMLHELITV